MLKLMLERKNQNRHRTLGELTGPELRLATLEPPWLNNSPRMSCIPVGTYEIYRSWYNAKNYEVFELRGVPDRSEILIHVGNVPRDTEGCILVGMDWGLDCVQRSKEGFGRFMDYMIGTETAQLTIK